jgi:hypothetical protein
VARIATATTTNRSTAASDDDDDDDDDNETLHDGLPNCLPPMSVLRVRSGIDAMSFDRTILRNMIRKSIIILLKLINSVAIANRSDTSSSVLDESSAHYSCFTCIVLVECRWIERSLGGVFDLFHTHDSMNSFDHDFPVSEIRNNIRSLHRYTYV